MLYFIVDHWESGDLDGFFSEENVQVFFPGTSNKTPPPGYRVMTDESKGIVVG